MIKYLIVVLIISLSSCNGGRLGDLLIGAHRQLHNKVHDVADAVIGGFGLTHGHHQPAPRPPNQGGETIVVIVEENTQGGQGNPARPYGTPQEGHYPAPNAHNPYQGHNPPNNGYNEGNQNNGHNHNQGRPNYGSSHGYDPQLNYPANPGHDPYQNGNKYGNNGQQQNIPSYPNQQGQYHNDQDHNLVNQNNNVLNNNAVLHPTNDINNPYPTANEVKNPDSTNKNNESNKKPKDDEPLLVPLNGYTYEGDKIVINAPKRETGDGDKKNEESEEDFPIDIRFKDE
ncbi:uncharacterized protein DDB_G0287625-like [Cydia amplana]|uniref:uncharacterized protein DDB_G0287625-like n=1 Tax=Cydia amplana TaxID=1869771 RepID=UPI002FE5B6CF